MSNHKIDKTEYSNKLNSDRFKWVLVFLGVLAGVVANFCFSTVPWPVRAAIGIVLSLALLFLASRTRQGGRILLFMQGARSELRKVTWPTRHETVQLTGVVVIVVIFAALLLWGLDSLFMLGIGWLTGNQGGGG